MKMSVDSCLLVELISGYKILILNTYMSVSAEM